MAEDRSDHRHFPTVTELGIRDGCRLGPSTPLCVHFPRNELHSAGNGQDLSFSDLRGRRRSEMKPTIAPCNFSYVTSYLTCHWVRSVAMTEPFDPALEDRLARLPERKRQLARTLLVRTASSSPGAPSAEGAAPATAQVAGPAASSPRDGLRSSLFFFSAAGDVLAADTYRFVLDAARFADTHGFEAVWVPERHFNEFGAPYPNPAVLAAAVAVTTSRVNVRGGQRRAAFAGPGHGGRGLGNDPPPGPRTSRNRLRLWLAPG